jgi:hypothetical protein
MANQTRGFGLRPIGKVGQNTTRKPTWTNNLQASNTATDILGYVADDPYERFEIKSNDSNASAQTDVFQNANIVYAAGDSANYVSAVRLDNSTINTTNTLQLRIIGPSTNIGNDDLGSAGVTWVVNINKHFFTQTTGV